MFLLHRTRCLGLPGLQDGDCRPADAFLRGPDAARRGVLTRKGVAFTVNRLSFRQPFVCAPGTTTAIKAGELCEPFSAFLQRSCWPLWLFRPDVRGSEKPPVAPRPGWKTPSATRSPDITGATPKEKADLPQNALREAPRAEPDRNSRRPLRPPPRLRKPRSDEGSRTRSDRPCAARFRRLRDAQSRTFLQPLPGATPNRAPER